MTVYVRPSATIQYTFYVHCVLPHTYTRTHVLIIMQVYVCDSMDCRFVYSELNRQNCELLCVCVLVLYGSVFLRTCECRLWMWVLCALPLRICTCFYITSNVRIWFCDNKRRYVFVFENKILAEKRRVFKSGECECCVNKCALQKTHIYMYKLQRYTLSVKMYWHKLTGTRNLDFQMRTPFWRAYTYTHIRRVLSSARLHSQCVTVSSLLSFSLIKMHASVVKFVCAWSALRKMRVYTINAYKTCLKLKRVYHNITFLFIYYYFYSSV